jgi:peptidyl-prolyl cis-trans isomerase SurA
MKFISCLTLLLATLSCAQVQAQPAAKQTPPAGPDSTTIAAVVNGQVITNQDVADRARLVAVSTGMAPTPEALARLEPQVTSLLIDQTLEQQEINKHKVVVPESEVIDAITHIEQGNGLPPGGLRTRLAAAGIPFDTLVNQVRTGLGWQKVLHEVLGRGLRPTPADIDAEKTALKAEIGSTQYHLAEIFIPVSDPSDDANAKLFANSVIKQLRAGAPFRIVAAQFSQSPSALQGGDLGFVQLSQLDTPVAAIARIMPVGAISDPIRVPGGYDIIQLEGKHEVGNEQQTILSMRQAFAPFNPPITNGQVGPAQIAVINKLVHAAAAAHACSDIASVNAAFGNVHPADPGPVNLATVTPAAFQQLLASLPPNQVSRPLVAQNGVTVVMVCSRQQEKLGLPSDQAIEESIVEHRVELESQQLLDDLRHRSIITQDNSQ